MSAGGRGGLLYPLGCPRSSQGLGPPLSRNSKADLHPGRLDQPVAALRGIGKDTERKLSSLGIQTIGDLLSHLPFRHESAAGLAEIGSLSENQEVNLRVRVVSCALYRSPRRRVSVLEALVSDHTGSVLAVWYNQPYLEETFRRQPEIFVRGTLQRTRKRGSVFVVKRHEVIGEAEESRHVLGLIPVYPSTGDLSVRTIRNLLHKAAPLARHLLDPLPAELLARRHYPGKAEAIVACHFPEVLGEAEVARERLAFEELLLLQVAVLERRRELKRQTTAEPLGAAGELAAAFLAALPYRPTSAQLRVMAEIDADLDRATPMRRLLHGDVGSGKTIVAAYCMLRAVEKGGQAALMAPTEVLADQHYLGLTERLSALGVRVGLLKGSLPAAERRATRSEVARGRCDVLVGTHALIQEGVRFNNLLVAVVDEQHRFGVRQREAILLAGEKERRPHTLHMSATPIPRTLSLTLYGDLDVSVLDELPPGRRPVRTRLVFPEAHGRMWEFVRRQLHNGRQVYVVCPLIEESEALQTASATETHAQLAQGELRDFRLGLLHGQLAPSEKGRVMAGFAAGDIQVLVSTSVIEVGIDVPNATVMVILGARRFGLSQLHQLRGRVGRGALESYCLLPIGEEDATVLDRLALFARTLDGFALAEADLLTRGAGELFGERQSGLGDLEVASLVRDRPLLEEAREEAERLLARLEQERREQKGPEHVPTGEGGYPERSPAAHCSLAAWSMVVEAAEARFGPLLGRMERV
jgi:ATP-dependent DNA helicase RecG